MFEERIAAMNADTERSCSYPDSFEKRTYTVTEIQDILGISQPTAYSLIKENLFHSIRVGRHIRISKKSFDEWLDTQA